MPTGIQDEKGAIITDLLAKFVASRPDFCYACAFLARYALGASDECERWAVK